VVPCNPEILSNNFILTWNHGFRDVRVIINKTGKQSLTSAADFAGISKLFDEVSYGLFEL